MKFCKNLIRDINFEPDAIQPCCNTHGIVVPRFNFSGDSFNIEDYTAHIQEIANLIQDQDKTDICKNCPSLTDIDNKGFDATIKFATVSLNMHRFLCNCKCVYCNFWKTHRPSYRILPILKSMHEQDTLYEDCFFSWGGGEPTIQPDFEETSHWISENNWQQYVHTNALKFSPTLCQILERNNTGVNISLDSASSEVYKRVKGVDGFDVVVRNLRKYDRIARRNIDLKYIIFEKNNDIIEIKNFLQFAKTLHNIRWVEFSFDFREVNDHKVSTKTKVAASFFVRLANELGLRYRSFFVGDDIIEEIGDILEK